MNNADKLCMERNREREIARKEPFEIIKASEIKFSEKSEKSIKLMSKICEEIEREKISYLEANEALYRIDIMLRERALEVPIALREEF